MILIGFGEDYLSFSIQTAARLYVGETTTVFQTLNMIKALYMGSTKIGGALKRIAIASGLTRSGHYANHDKSMKGRLIFVTLILQFTALVTYVIMTAEYEGWHLFSMF